MRFALHFALLASFIAFAGCSSSGEPVRVSVSGDVTVDGKPMDDVMLQFVPRDGARGSTVLVTAGRFTTGEEQGPTPGEFDIVVTPNAPEAEQAFELIQLGERDPMKLKTVPAAYRQPGKLSATVTADGPNMFRFELKSR